MNIPAARKAHWLQPTVGHYGVFNGSRFRAEIAPRIADFILTNEAPARAGPQISAPDPEPRTIAARITPTVVTKTKTNGSPSKRPNGRARNGESQGSALRRRTGPRLSLA